LRLRIIFTRDYNRANDGVSVTYFEVLNVNPYQINGH